MTTKIATCCYCGSQTVLKLTARGGHELACGRCGAPLHEMKSLRVRKDPDRKVKPGRPSPGPRSRNDHDDGPRRRKKRRKPIWSRALEEAFDFVEDIFD